LGVLGNNAAIEGVPYNRPAAAQHAREKMGSCMHGSLSALFQGEEYELHMMSRAHTCEAINEAFFSMVLQQV
jgi:hypothetical protein